MTLIKSVSGFRGTIGGKSGDNLTPLDVVKFTSAFATVLLEEYSNPVVIIGRDGRISGQMVQGLVIHTLSAMGINTIDLGLSTTPTVEYMVLKLTAQGGIILTASHNERHWNALKMLNQHGEIISIKYGQRILEIAKKESFEYAQVNRLGKLSSYDDAISDHIQGILKLDIIDTNKIKERSFKVVVDCINSTGGLAFRPLLEALGVDYCFINDVIDGNFKRNPEPLSNNLSELSTKVTEVNADLGIAVDPDVDRLVLIDEKGKPFGEEYTIVSCVDYVLSRIKGNTVSNLSTTRAVRDITKEYGGKHYDCPVGEFFVVDKMKQVNAVIGGEGSGGVIYPKLHYGRDALVGAALFLSLLASRAQTVSELKNSYPIYFMCKEKIHLSSSEEIENALVLIKEKYRKYHPILTDGVKIDFEESWAHIRKSNTEPIIRIYTEAKSQNEADLLARKIRTQLKN